MKYVLEIELPDDMGMRDAVSEITRCVEQAAGTLRIGFVNDRFFRSSTNEEIGGASLRSSMLKTPESSDLARIERWHGDAWVTLAYVGPHRVGGDIQVGGETVRVRYLRRR